MNTDPHLPTDFSPAADASAGRPIAILKLDDFGSKTDHPPENWQRVIDFLAAESIPCSFGVIGRDFRQATPALCAWMREQHQAGTIEMWNHGLSHKREQRDGKMVAEFQESYREQLHSLEETQRLAKERVGIEMTVFGAPYNAVNEDTVRALEALSFPVWLYGEVALAEAGGYSGLVLARSLNLERVAHEPDFENFAGEYEAANPVTTPLILQGHPNSWDPARFAEFVEIIHFLKQRGWHFMTPSAYADSLSAKG
ncbi:polysaccharide deacetylase family protein [Kiritimatiellaeota bacterium B1221]|nr:polysaccharide deacetylase family protein [Kiritimatiellaeota bacterium B1221]